MDYNDFRYGFRLICPSCHTANPDALPFCPGCGASMELPGRDDERPWVRQEEPPHHASVDPEPRHDYIVEAWCVCGPSAVVALAYGVVFPFICIFDIVLGTFRPPWHEITLLFCAWLAALGWFVIAVRYLHRMTRSYISDRRERPYYELGYCRKCRYDLRGTLAAGGRQCPECGTPIADMDREPRSLTEPSADRRPRR
jgi:hypothetical protein